MKASWPVSGVGRLAREDLAQDRTEAEHVRALVHVLDLAERLLGRHVGERAHDRARDGLGALALRAHGGDRSQIGRDGAGRALVGDPASREHLREAPVEHLHLTEGADHHVGRLQVPVDHAARVGVANRLADLLEDLQEPSTVVRDLRAIIEQRGERLPLHELHCEEGALVGLQTQLVDGHDPRVLELPTDLRFFDEALEYLEVAEVAVVDHLERHVPTQIGVAALENLPDAPAGELAQDLEPAALAQRHLPEVEVGGAFCVLQGDVGDLTPLGLETDEDAIGGAHDYLPPFARTSAARTSAQ